MKMAEIFVVHQEILLQSIWRKSCLCLLMSCFENDRDSAGEASESVVLLAFARALRQRRVGGLRIETLSIVLKHNRWRRLEAALPWWYVRSYSLSVCVIHRILWCSFNVVALYRTFSWSSEDKSIMARVTKVKRKCKSNTSNSWMSLKRHTKLRMHLSYAYHECLESLWNHKRFPMMEIMNQFSMISQGVWRCWSVSL